MSINEVSAREINQYIPITRKTKTFIDVSLSFNPSPVTDDITLLTNESAINNAIKNIVMFLPTEVPFDPTIGSYAQRYLFDIVDDINGGLLQDEIRRAILFCEPRVTFKQLNPDDGGVGYGGNFNLPAGLPVQDNLGVFVEAQPDQNSFAVTVRYRIVGSEKIFKIQEILTPTR